MTANDRTIARLLRQLTASFKRELRAIREADLLRHALLVHVDAAAEREAEENAEVEFLATTILAKHVQHDRMPEAIDALKMYLRDLDDNDTRSPETIIGTWAKKYARRRSSRVPSRARGVCALCRLKRGPTPACRHPAFYE